MKRACLAISFALTCAPVTAPAAPSTPKKAKKLLKKGNKHLKKGKWNKAIDLYGRALEIAPRAGAIHVNLARAYSGADRCARSLLHFQAYLGINPDASDRQAINTERKECVLKLGDVARLTVEVQEPDEDEELAPMPTAGDDQADAQGEEDEGSSEGEEEAEDPNQMDISLDGVPVGRTPLAGLILAAGDYVLGVTRPGLEPQTHALNLKAAEGTEMLLDVQGRLAPGVLTLQVKPHGALVSLMGKPLGASPDLAPQTLAPGPYVLEITDPNGGHLPWKGEVRVASGQEEEFEIALERKTGVIVVRAPPGAAVLVNHEPRQAGRPIEVPEGVYDVRVMMSGRAPWQRTVEVPLGNTIELVANPAPEGSRPGMDRWRMGALGAGGASLLAAIGGGVAGASARAQYGDIEDRIALDGGYATNAEIDDIEGKQFTANAMFGIALVAGAASAVLWFHEELGLGASDTPTASPPAAQPPEAHTDQAVEVDPEP